MVHCDKLHAILLNWKKIQNLVQESKITPGFKFNINIGRKQQNIFHHNNRLRLLRNEILIGKENDMLDEVSPHFEFAFRTELT